MAESDVDYLTRTATPGGTMTRQGVRQSIERLHPAFRASAAATVRAARAAGMKNAGIYSSYRAPNWGVGGFANKKRSLHAYGAAIDFTGIGRPGSKTAKEFYDLATANGIYNPYGPNNRAEWNHFQLVPTKGAPPEWQAVITGRPPQGPDDLASIWSATGIPFDGAAFALSKGPTPPASVSALGSRTLKLKSKLEGGRMRGPDVKALQETLMAAGYDVGPYGADGVYGTGTRDAVKAYQRAYNATRVRNGLAPIAVDGVVGTDTREPMVRAMEAQRTNLPGVARFNALQRQNLPGVARYEAMRGGQSEGTPVPFDVARQTPDRAIGPLGASPARLTPDRAVSSLAGALQAPRGNLAMTAPQAGGNDPTQLSREDFFRAVSDVPARLVNPYAPSVTGNQISTRSQFQAADPRAAALQQVRDVQGPVQVAPRNIGVDPRNLPVTAGRSDFGGYTQADRQANQIQNLLGRSLAGSIRPQTPQVAFGGATGRGPSTVAPSGPPAPRQNPELATVDQMRESFRRIPMPRGGSVPIAVGSAAKGMSQTTPRKVPTDPVRAVDSRQVLGSPMTPSGYSRAAISAFSTGRPAQKISASVAKSVAPAVTPTYAQKKAVFAQAPKDLSYARPKSSPFSALSSVVTRPSTTSLPGVARYNAVAPTVAKVPYNGPPPSVPGAAPMGLPAVSALGMGASLAPLPARTIQRRMVAGVSAAPSGFMATGKSGGFNVLDSDRVSPGSKATYGRKQSDGSVRGTTSSGAGYISRDGGRTVSVKGKTYTKNKRNEGYSRQF